MDHIKAFEAKTHFSALLDRVEAGEEIAISRRGEVIARLVPAKSTPQSEVADAVRRLRSRRKALSLKGLSIRDMIEEGRR